MHHFDPTEIERFLLARRDWVSVRELCERFGIRARILRQLGSRSGVLTKCAISHSRMGLKHVACASTAEYLHAKHAMRRHAISELRRGAAWDRRRRQVVRSFSRPAVTVERDTGQLIMQFNQEVPIHQ
jgi:hypothetical protein